MFFFNLHTPKINKQVRKVMIVAQPNIRCSAWFCKFYVIQLTKISDTLQKYSTFTFWIRALLLIVSCNTFFYVASKSNISSILHEKKTRIDSQLLFIIKNFLSSYDYSPEIRLKKPRNCSKIQPWQPNRLYLTYILYSLPVLQNSAIYFGKIWIGRSLRKLLWKKYVKGTCWSLNIYVLSY